MIILKVIAFFFCSGIVAAAFGWAASFGETKEEREAEVNVYRRSKVIELDEAELAIS